MSNALELQKLSSKSNLMGSRQVRSKKLFPETIIHKISETNSSFRVKQHTLGKFKFSFSGYFHWY